MRTFPKWHFCRNFGWYVHLVVVALAYTTLPTWSFQHHAAFGHIRSLPRGGPSYSGGHWAKTKLGDSSGPRIDAADANSRDSKKGYQFGDITRGVLGRLQSRVNALTGKEKYEFGDLSKWLDAQAKEGIVQLDQASKKKVQQFTQRPTYQFGDITRELIRRFQDGDYNAEDLWLFLRIALLIGKQLVPPIAAALPVRVLMELVEVSMAQSVSEDLTAMLSSEVSQRMKQFVTGDKNYQFGDIAKKILTGNTAQELAEKGKQVAAGRFTGQDVAAVGDISVRLWKKYREKQNKHRAGTNDTSESSSKSPGSTSNGSTEAPQGTTMEDTELSRFEEWDRKFLASKRETNGTKGLVSNEDLKQWDECLLEVTERDARGTKGDA